MLSESTERAIRVLYVEDDQYIKVDAAIKEILKRQTQESASRLGDLLQSSLQVVT